MLPSMFSGISGLKANQKKLDVVGNNIANSSTTAFKSQRARFQDMISQTMSSAVGPGVNTGGVNGKQVGLGVQLAGIDTTTSVGNMQPTSRSLDAAIDGSGYFVVARGSLAEADKAKLALTENYELAAGADDADAAGSLSPFYTRDGSFTLDSQGNLLTSDGYRVLGYAINGAAITYSTDANAQATVGLKDANEAGAKIQAVKDALVPLVIPDKVGTERIQSFTIEKDGQIKATTDKGKTAVLGQIAMASFKNDAGLKKLGKNLYEGSANSGAPLFRSGVGAEAAADNSKAYGDMLQGVLEMSNVDLAEQFTDMIIASRAFQANGKIISTGDEILQDLVNLKR